jgi:hypothetical protein
MSFVIFEFCYLRFFNNNTNNNSSKDSTDNSKSDIKKYFEICPLIFLCLCYFILTFKSFLIKVIKSRHTKMIDRVITAISNIITMIGLALLTYFLTLCLFTNFNSKLNI